MNFDNESPWCLPSQGICSSLKKSGNIDGRSGELFCEQQNCRESMKISEIYVLRGSITGKKLEKFRLRAREK